MILHNIWTAKAPAWEVTITDLAALPASAAAAACGSHQACCGRYHAGALAPTPEALLRARFSAYAMQNVDYLVATTHKQVGAQLKAEEQGKVTSAHTHTDA